MDKTILAQRNQHMAEALHQTTMKQTARRVLIRTAKLFRLKTSPRTPERILIIRPDHLGDVLLSTPAIQALRQSRPSAEIHVLAGPWSAEILGNYSEIDLVLTTEFPGFDRKPSKSTSILHPYKQLAETARKLRKVGYSCAIIMRPDHWWGAVLAYMAGIPQIIGFDLPDVAPFLTDALEHTNEHVVLQSMRLVSHLTGPDLPEHASLHFPVTDADRQYVQEHLIQKGMMPDDRLICIHPGSGTWVKQWTPGKWAETADMLGEQLNSHVVFTGGDKERTLVQSITEQMSRSAYSLVSETNINQLGALYERAQLVLGPDSGPLHLAVAVGTPTTTLFGPADPGEFGPWGDHHKHPIVTYNIACRPCRILDWGDDKAEYHPCVRDIPVWNVLNAARHAASYKTQANQE